MKVATIGERVHLGVATSLSYVCLQCELKKFHFFSEWRSFSSRASYYRKLISHIEQTLVERSRAAGNCFGSRAVVPGLHAHATGLNLNKPEREV